MNTVTLIISLASVVSLIGYIWLVVVGFKRSVLWGILVLLFSPLTAIIFAAMNWFDAKKAFLLYIIPTVIILASFGYMFTQGMDNFAEINRRVQTGELTQEEAVQLMQKSMQLQPGENLFTDQAGDANTELAGTAGTQAVTDATVSGTETSVADKTVAPDAAGKEVAMTTSQAGDKQAVVNPDKVDERVPSIGYPDPAKVEPDPLAVPRKKEDPDFLLVRFERVKNYKGRYFVIYTKQETYLRGLLVKADDKAIYLNRKLFGGSFEYRVAKHKIDKIYMLKKEFVAARDRDRLPRY